MELNNAASETIKDGSLTIENSKGQLSYKNTSITAINTMSTPKGGQYKLTLADGTKVWLNAVSSITYPTAFNEKVRQVSITGEVYFEVAKDPSKKFLVTTGETTTEVLGTHFNINSYKDEQSTQITLVEGRVKISAANQQTIIDPGQQAETTSDGKLKVNKNVDVLQITAWQKGMFEFNQQRLEPILRQVSRWFDVEIKYEGKVPDATFSGGLSRKLPLSEVMKLLKANGVNCRLERKILIVKG